MDWLFGRLSFTEDLGIDLGTANTLVASKDRGIILNEPSVVAVYRGTNEVILDGMGVGNEAYRMLGKTPGNITAIRPLKGGVIADFEITEKMLRYYLRKAHEGRNWVKPRVVVAVPSGITTVERQAVVNSAERAGARKVYLVDEPIAAGLGSGLPITEAVGSMIVDIGGGTTEVAVLSLGGPVVVSSVKTRRAMTWTRPSSPSFVNTTPCKWGRKLRRTSRRPSARPCLWSRKSPWRSPGATR